MIEGSDLVAQRHMVYASATGTPYLYWSARGGAVVDLMHSGIITAEAAMTSGRNDMMLLTPEAHSLAASLTWDLNNSIMQGMAPEGLMNSRARIGMSTAFTPMMTISGYGNLFKNFYLQHGTAAADLIGVDITGSRNTFDHVHFAGPMNALQASEAGFIGVRLSTVAETRFRSCVFGNHTQSCDEASSLVKISTGCGITIFDDCLFFICAGDTDPIFVTVDNQSDTGMTLFRNCTFIADPGTAGTPAIAFKFLGSSMGYVYLDNRCQFVNVTNITATTTDGFVRAATTLASTDDDVGMIASTLDLA
jgi:hypothetical protein